MKNYTLDWRFTGRDTLRINKYYNINEGKLNLFRVYLSIYNYSNYSKLCAKIPITYEIFNMNN